MKKRIIVVLLLLVGIAFRASAVKVAYVDRDSVINSLAVMKNFESDYVVLENEYKMELDIMVRNYNNKVKKYIAAEKTQNVTIRKARQAEITEMELRIDKYKKAYTEALKEFRAASVAPVDSMFVIAVRAVSERDSINIVFDNGTPVYLDDTCVDITGAVIEEMKSNKEVH